MCGYLERTFLPAPSSDDPHSSEHWGSQRCSRPARRTGSTRPAVTHSRVCWNTQRVCHWKKHPTKFSARGDWRLRGTEPACELPQSAYGSGYQSWTVTPLTTTTRPRSKLRRQQNPQIARGSWSPLTAGQNSPRVHQSSIANSANGQHSRQDKPVPGFATQVGCVQEPGSWTSRFLDTRGTYSPGGIQDPSTLYKSVLHCFLQIPRFTIINRTFGR